jgi:hypothetical protein
MSINDRDLLGGFTELEISAGVHGLVFEGCGDNEFPSDRVANYKNNKLKEEKEFLTNIYDDEKRKHIIDAIVGLDHTPDITSETIRLMIVDEVNYIIKRFGRRERIPQPYLNIILEDQSLESFIKGFLSKCIGIWLNDSIVEEVNNFSDELKENSKLETVFDRVGKIQNFIHNKAIFLADDESFKKLPREKMRILLASSKLYLSLFDCYRHKNRFRLNIEYSGLRKLGVPNHYFGYLFNKSLLMAELEKGYPNIVEPFNGNFIEHWNVRYKKPISYYCSGGMRKRIESIKCLSSDLDILEIKERCISIYSVL